MPVGGHDSVAAEVIVVGRVSETAAVVEPAVRLARLVEGLVHPVPYAPSDHAFGAAGYIVPVTVQVPDGVAHGVVILAEEEWFLISVTVSLDHAFHGGIHTRVHIGDLIHALVVDGT